MYLIPTQQLEAYSYIDDLSAIGLAEALFDNPAEWPDELEFRRGDLLRVLDEKPGGGLADGWWYCADQQGNKGIAPANRLRLIRRFGGNNNTARNDRVITPRRIGDLFLYHPNELFNDGDSAFDSLRTSFNSYDYLPRGAGFNLLNDSLYDQASHSLRPGQSRATSTNTGGDYSTPPSLFRNTSEPPPNINKQVYNVPIKVEGRSTSLAGSNKLIQQGSQSPTPSTISFSSAAAGSVSASPQIASFQLPPMPPPRPTDSSSGSSGSKKTVKSRQQSTMKPVLVDTNGEPLLLPPGSVVDLQNPVFQLARDSRESSGTSGFTSSLSNNSAQSSSNRSSIQSMSDQGSNRSSSSNHDSYDIPSPAASKLPTKGSNSSQSGSQSTLVGSATNSNRQTPVRSIDNENDDFGPMLMKVVDASKDDHNSKSSSNSRGYGSLKSNTGSRSALVTQTPVASSNPNLDTSSQFGAFNTYDIPLAADKRRPSGLRQQHSQTLPKAPTASAIMTSFSSKEGNTTTSSNMTQSSSRDSTDSERLSISSVDSRDNDYKALFEAKQLNLGIVEAQSQCDNLQHALHEATYRLSNFVTSTWRKRIFLEKHIFDIRMTCKLVASCLSDFVDFASGAFVNASRSSDCDPMIYKRLAHLLRPLRESQRMIKQAHIKLESKSWKLDYLIREQQTTNDALDQFVAIAKTLSDDSKQLSTFIKSKAQWLASPPPPNKQVNGRSSSESPSHHNVIAKLQSRPLPSPLTNGDYGVISERQRTLSVSDQSLFDDYAFVEGRPNSEQGSATTPTAGSNSNGFSTPPVNIEPVGISLSENKNDVMSMSPLENLHEEDLQILKFYASQVNQHSECLSNAIDQFLNAIERNQPPKVFVGESKLVILAAHKLVYMADSIVQVIHHVELSCQLKSGSDALADMLKISVVSTKQAALNHPAITNIQAMVDSMVGISHSAHRLKLLIHNATR